MTKQRAGPFDRRARESLARRSRQGTGRCTAGLAFARSAAGLRARSCPALPRPRRRPPRKNSALAHHPPVRPATPPVRPTTPPARPAAAPAGAAAPCDDEDSGAAPAPAPRPSPRRVRRSRRHKRLRLRRRSRSLATPNCAPARRSAGTIFARDQRGADVPVTLSDEKVEKDVRTLTLRLPAASAPRAVAIFWRADPKPQTTNVAERKPLETTLAGVVEIFRSRRGRPQGVPARSQGGRPLSRRNARPSRDGRHARHAVPAAHRRRRYQWLRAQRPRAGLSSGRTISRFRCKAKEATGRLGLSATPAPMLTTGILSATAACARRWPMAAARSRRSRFPEAGLYRLDSWSRPLIFRRGSRIPRLALDRRPAR